jgi:hypothetical protein
MRSSCSTCSEQPDMALARCGALQVCELESQLGGLRSEKSGMLSYMSSKDSELDSLRAQLQDLQQHADTVQHKLDKVGSGATVAEPVPPQCCTWLPVWPL